MKPKNYQSFDPCTACHTESVDRCFHHIYTQKTRPDLAGVGWNLMPLCLECHNEVHAVGMMKFSEIISVRNFLLENEWVVNEFYNEWEHYE